MYIYICMYSIYIYYIYIYIYFRKGKEYQNLSTLKHLKDVLLLKDFGILSGKIVTV